MVQRRTSYWERIMLESRLSEMVIQYLLEGIFWGLEDRLRELVDI